MTMWSWTEPPACFDRRTFRLTTSMFICSLRYLPQGLAVITFPSFLEVELLALKSGQILVLVKEGAKLTSRGALVGIVDLIASQSVPSFIRFK